MNAYILSLTTLGFSYILIFIYMLLIPYFVHLMQMKDVETYEWGNYKLFKREFKKYNWEYDGYNSLFDRKNNSKIHAKIFMFNNKGMKIWNPISYFKISLLIRKQIKKEKAKIHREKINW